MQGSKRAANGNLHDDVSLYIFYTDTLLDLAVLTPLIGKACDLLFDFILFAFDKIAGKVGHRPHIRCPLYMKLERTFCSARMYE